MKETGVIKAATAASLLIKRYRWTIIFMICWYAGMALLLNACIQRSIGIPDFIFDHPRLYFAGSAVMLFTLVIAHGVFGNPVIGTCAVSGCLIVLMTADQLKFALRMEHVYPGDLEMFFHLDQLEGMYDAEGTILPWLIAGAIAAAGWVFTFFRMRARKRRIATGTEKLVGWPYARHRLILRVCLAGLGLAALFAFTWPVRNPYAGDIKSVDYQYIAWNQTLNYERNGYVAAFISNLRGTSMKEPAGYTEERVQEIADRYAAVADTQNKGRIDLAGEDVDVVYIMNEAFSDPDRFSAYYPFSGPTEELMPNLHRIYESAAAGWVYSPRYGGGTANIEYEALTGMATYFSGFAYPFQSILPAFDHFPSIENLLDDPDRMSVGLHAYGASMYRRNAVYPILGFDRFYGSADFKHRARDRDSYYISDASAYREVQTWLDGHGETQSDNYFITLITMQNHPQYGHQYDERAFTSLADVDYETSEKIADYMELIHSSDAALGDFIDWVSAREKKTAVVFWGDHLPGVYGNLFEINKDLAYETPFFVYTNYEEDRATGKKEIVPSSVSSNYISTVFFDMMSAKKPPWYYLLDDAKEALPILTTAYWQDAAPEESQALSDYRIIAYDMLRGEQYALGYGLFDISDVP